MNIEDYYSQMKQIQNNILSYLEVENHIEEKYEDLIKLFEDMKIQNDKNKINSVIRILLGISNNHNRSTNFFNKIEQILKYFKNSIKKHFTNLEIFNIFKSNKRVLLILINESILSMDKQIAKKLFQYKYKKFKYPQYFAPELKPFISELEGELSNVSEEEDKYEYDDRGNLKCNDFYDSGKYIQGFESDGKLEKIIQFIWEELPENFEENRKKGQNESNICKLIQNDLIDEFISYVNQNQISLKMNIKSSIFETNPFLLDKKSLEEWINRFKHELKTIPKISDISDISLINYAAFFGSIQIFKYLYLNGVEIDLSIWLFAIHGNHPEIINFIEENLKDKENIKHEILLESIKCHHNDITNYIEMNYFQLEELTKFERETFIQFIKYHNYEFDIKKIDFKEYFFELCKYDYYFIVEFILANQKIDINKKYQNQVFKTFRGTKFESYNYFETALGISVRKENIEIVKLLLAQNDIDINILNEYKRYNTYCKYMHSNYNEIQIDFRYRDILHITDDTHIVTFDHEDLLDKETYIKTALYIAVEKENIDIINILLLHSNIDINIENTEYRYFWGNRRVLIEKYMRPAVFKAIEKRNSEIAIIRK